MDTNLKPLLRVSTTTGERKLGFLNVTTGDFTVDRIVKDERDIDNFLMQYDLAVVMVAKM